MHHLFPVVHQEQFSTDMKRQDLYRLKNKLNTLAVFRRLLDDKVIRCLCDYLDLAENGDKQKAIFCYAQFVGKLYDANGGCLAKYIKQICDNDENVYVKTIGQKQQLSQCIYNSVQNELAILQEVADLSCKDLSAWFECDCLPQFEECVVDLAESMATRVKDISKYGYGIYAKHSMFYVNSQREIVPVSNPDDISIDDLVDYQAERQIVIDNTRALLDCKPAANMLLTGDAGTGKSSTIKAVANMLFDEGLRIVEVRKDQLAVIPSVLNQLASNPLRFILFIDDLSFLKDDDNFNALKAVLEGSVSAKSKNVVIYATSNRRHIIKQKFSDRDGDEINVNETLQEFVSLSDRFGLHVTFQKPTKSTYLNIVHNLADKAGLQMDKMQLDLLAERFALERGGRSARGARQFVDGLLAKQK